MRGTTQDRADVLPWWLSAAGFGFALAMRGFWLLWHQGNFDTALYVQFAAAAKSGANLYTTIEMYKWSPLWAHTLAFLEAAGAHVGLPLHRAVGLLLLGVDAASAGLLYRIALRLDRTRAQAQGAALLFFANPVSILASGFDVQWDSISILFLLAAVLAALSPKRPKASLVAALTASLWIKHVTWFHPLVFVRDRRRGSWSRLEALLPYGLFFLAFLPYAGAWRSIVKNVFGYRGRFDEYGMGLLQERGWLPGWAATLVLLVAVATTVVLSRWLDPARASLRLFLVVLIFTPGIWQYYFVWPIALGSLFAGPGYAIYTVIAAAFWLHSPDGMMLDWRGLPDWQGVWWATVLWLLLEIREGRGRDVRPHPESVA